MNKTIQRIIIVDDEPLAIQSLRMVLMDIGSVEIVAECANGYQAVKAVQELEPDLMFLDIQMPGLSGFDVLDALGKDAPATVFVTAFDEYAIKAFNAHAIDYLLKPVQRSRVEETLNHAGKFVLPNVDNFRKMQLPAQRIIVRSGSQVNIIPVEHIIYIEAQDDYVNINTKYDSFLKYERLGHLETVLDNQKFVRVHRSFIIHLKYLIKIGPYGRDSKLAHLENDSTVPVSRSGLKRLQEVM